MAVTRQRVTNSRGMRASGLEGRQALLQRVWSSRHFEKSARIQEFLRYVCERASQEPSTEIHEQEIGHWVFGRPADYDTSQDNIVRVTASQARKKLEQYFATEGAWEATVLEIPRGQYVPIFRKRSAAREEPASAPPEPRRQYWPAIRPRLVLTLAACAPLLAMLAIWLAAELRNQRLAARSELEANPVLNALWSQLLPGGGRTDLVVADSSLSLFEDLIDRPLTLSEYLKPDLWSRNEALSSKPDRQVVAELAARRRYTSLPSVTVAYRIAQLVGRDRGRVFVCSARDFSVRQMKLDNVILLGSRRANPWVELIEDRFNFRFGYDGTSRESYFQNRQPHPGELPAYRNDKIVSYCHIAFLPNLGRTGNILVIAGTEIEGTETGGEFVTSEHSIAQLRPFAPLDGHGRLPYFEVLLKSSKVGGATPGFAIVAFRLLPA